MNREECLKYLRLLLTDTQRARSIHFEGGGTDDAQELLGIEPWIFGKKCIVAPLTKLIDRFESDETLPLLELRTMVMNFAYIARNSLMLDVLGAVSKRDNPSHSEIFDIGGEGDGS